jgi:hypothetical protein
MPGDLFSRDSLTVLRSNASSSSAVSVEYHPFMPQEASSIVAHPNGLPAEQFQTWLNHSIPRYFLADCRQRSLADVVFLFVI